MASVAKGFRTLHGDYDFSMKDHIGSNKLFSACSLLDRETIERFKSPDKS